jgi:hypothetical protein
MSKVVALMSMSLDGYVAARNDGVADVFLGNPTVIQGVGVTHLLSAA